MGDDTDTAPLLQKLRAFADEAAGASPLYEHLARHAAEDQEVAGLLAAAEPEFRVPTLLFAAAHRLIQAEPFHPLANYYPSLGGTYGVDGQTWPVFREFLLGRADQARKLIGTHTTQTNEVRRAAMIYPAVALAAKQAGGAVGLLEVGTSAGLLLNLDRYAYWYQTEQAGQIGVGPAKAAVGLHAALALAPGAELPVLPKKLTVRARVGLDRRPIDLGDEDQFAWLEACVWADQPERLRLLGAAAAVRRKHPPELLAGDAVDDLARAADRVPAELPLVVINSHAVCYLSEPRRVAYVQELARLAERRPLWWVCNEGYRAGPHLVLPGRADLADADEAQYSGVLVLTRWERGEPVARALATTAPHGQRLTWLPQPAG
ncbi:DUF2332 domain-containing protein [Goodfellowiella coeruleoviolacea]|uniref:DUF2332 domain-containing protein n=1 Tax=Goodfellowiella coeruleoviolacea TaxID=334858 RepID=A0AAE3GIF9_9PSEU|nr:DUF2332 domain-containing protein [Goodfellowiella coeruleoviolacea]MCP2168797.1 hypothetical protein [Goodfellowiella coeruleoviolacea]